MTEVQPWIVRPSSQATKIQTAIAMNTRNIMIPIKAINRIGRTVSEVMPSIARAIIFANVYRVSPYCRASRSYVTVAVLKPS